MRQANELGGHVRKGEESTAIVFWKVDDARDDPLSCIESKGGQARHFNGAKWPILSRLSRRHADDSLLRFYRV